MSTTPKFSKAFEDAIDGLSKDSRSEITRLFASKPVAQPQSDPDMRFPWHVCNINETMVLDAEGNEVAQVKGDYDTDYERMADRAHLISLTPELLEALTEVTTTLGRTLMYLSGRLQAEACDAYEKAQVAIGRCS